MSELAFRVRGKGFPVVLLHGFPMHQGIWNTFAEKLSRHYQVYTLDLPGFGASPGLQHPFTIDQVAKKVIDWMDGQSLPPCALIGHSLGGYVALAMAALAPEKFAALGLFHSTALADKEEKKQSRNKVIEFVQANGAFAFTSNFIAPLFANANHPAITSVRELSVTATAEAVIGYTEAMRDRPDRLPTLRTFPNPILFISGENDVGIPVESISTQAALCRQPEVHVLPNVAHMGMMENPDLTVRIVETFLQKVL